MNVSRFASPRHRTRRHADRVPSFEEVGRTIPDFAPTYTVDEEPLNREMQSIAEAPLIDGVLVDLGIPGWLRPSEALKLSELAYFARGHVLEFGTHQGLSTSIIARAIKARPPLTWLAALSGRPRRPHLVTVDLSEPHSRQAAINLAERGLADVVRFLAEDAAIVARILIAHEKTFSFCFVDHSHAYEPMLALCRLLPQLLDPGAFVLFHDYNDSRNTATTGLDEGDDYGVYAAAVDALDPGMFDYYGTYGSAGLYRRR